MTDEELAKQVAGVARKLRRERGIPYSQACALASRAVLRVLGQPPRAGMSQATALTKAAQLEPIRMAREAVSPWLWIFSLTGFGLTILNTRRIAKMFKGWKKKRA